MSRPFYEVLRILLGLLFLYAGTTKLLHLQDFAKTISDFGIVYPALERTAAVAFSSLEVATGIGLLVDLRGALAGVTLLLVTFTAVLGYGLYLGLDIDCGCLGPYESELLGSGLLAGVFRNTVLLGVCAALFWLRRRCGASVSGPFVRLRGP